MQQVTEEPEPGEVLSSDRTGSSSQADVQPTPTPARPTDPRKPPANRADQAIKTTDLTTFATTAAAAGQETQTQQQQQQQQGQQQTAAAGDSAQGAAPQAPAGAASNPPQQGAAPAAPSTIPPPRPPPGPPPPAKLRGPKGTSELTDMQQQQQHQQHQQHQHQHRGEEGPWGPWQDRRRPPPLDHRPWEPQPCWDDRGLGPPPLLPHWDERGPPPPHPAAYLDGSPVHSPRHRDQHQKHGAYDRRAFPPEGKWGWQRKWEPQQHMELHPAGPPPPPSAGGPPPMGPDARGAWRERVDVGYPGADSRELEFTPGRARRFEVGSRRDAGYEGRGRQLPEGRGPHREGAPLGPMGYRDQRGGPELHPEPPYGPDRNSSSGRGRVGDRSAYDLDNRHRLAGAGPGGEGDWCQDRRQRSEMNRDNDVVRRSGDRRRPPGPALGGRAVQDRTTAANSSATSHSRPDSPGKRGGSSHAQVGSKRRAAELTQQEPSSRSKHHNGDRSSERSSERSRERSSTKSRDVKSPHRSTTGSRSRSDGSPRKQLGPHGTSGYSNHTHPGSPARQAAADADTGKAPAATEHLDARQAGAAAITARRSSSVQMAPAADSSMATQVSTAGRDHEAAAAAPGLAAASMYVLIWAQQECIRLELRHLQACVPSLQPQPGAASTVQLVFVEQGQQQQQQQQRVVVAGPVTVTAAVCEEGRVGFAGEELKAVLQELHGSVILSMDASDFNPDRPKAADSSGWPDAFIVTVKRPDRPAAPAAATGLSSRDPRAAHMLQRQASSVQQAWVQQEAQQVYSVGGVNEYMQGDASTQQPQQQQQVVWQEQALQSGPSSAHEQLPWATVSMFQQSAAACSGQPNPQQQQQQHVVHVLQPEQLMMQQPGALVMSVDALNPMHAAVQGLQAVSPHVSAAGSAQFAAAGGLLMPAGLSHQFSTAGLQQGDGTGQALTGGVLLAAAGSAASAATATEDQGLAAAPALTPVAAAAAAAALQADTLVQQGGGSGAQGLESPANSTGAAGVAPTAAPHSASAGDDAAALAALLTAAAGPAAAMTDGVVDAVMDVVALLNKHHDPTLDIGSCAEALFEIQEDAAAAKKFMRVTYVALCSALRRNNPAGAVGVVKRYLQASSS